LLLALNIVPIAAAQSPGPTLSLAYVLPLAFYAPPLLAEMEGRRPDCFGCCLFTSGYWNDIDTLA